MRRLNHPNILQLLKVTDSEETLPIIMEYLSKRDFFSHWSQKPAFESQGLFCPNHQGSGSHQGH